MIAWFVFVLLCSTATAQRYGLDYPVVYPAAKEGGNYMHNFYLPPSPSTTPWAPAWAPDGKWIAVAMYGSIWRVDPKTGAAAEITYGKTYHSSPAFSPDGKWLVYTSDDDARSVNLEVLNLATGETKALTTGNHIHLDPVFSPDGKMVSYVSTEPSGYFNIYARKIDNDRFAGEPIALTKDSRYPRGRLYFGPWDFHMQPAWSPDGKEMFFLSNRGVPLGSGHLYRMPVQANGIDSAVAVLTEQSLYRARPNISKDGKRIIYASTAGAADQYNNLYVVPVGGGAPYKLTFGNYDHFHPRFSPDNEWIAYIHNRDGLPQLALLETYGGEQRDVPITSMTWKRPMGKLHVRVLDAETGATLHARIYGKAADGKFYAPRDAYSRLGRGAEHVFHTNGEYTVDAPAGRMKIEAAHGFDYFPGETEVEAVAGRTVAATISLRRMADPRRNGWFGGSTHVHMNYGGNLHNTPENLVFMSRAEGMDVVMNLAANKDNRILDHQYFVKGGGEHPSTRGLADVKMHMGEEYRPPFYGHVFFLGLKDHLISPFTTGYEGTGIESLYPSNTDMFRKARAQGALNGYVHAFSGDSDPLAGDLGVAKGFPVDAALGTVECIEWSGAGRGQLGVWHHALNNDLAIIPTGGEDSISNLHRIKLVGSVRTFVQSGGLSISAWFDALRAGKSYFSTGPLLEFTINGKGPGEQIKFPATGGTIHIEARAQSIGPLTKAVIHRNGKEWKHLPLSDGGHRASLKESVSAGDSAWYSLYVEGPPYRRLDGEFPQAATNTVRIYTGDKKIRNAESARYFQRWIDKLTAMAKEWPWWRSGEEQKHVLAQFEEARRIYRKLEEEAQ
jgi:TolB protein